MTPLLLGALCGAAALAAATGSGPHGRAPRRPRPLARRHQSGAPAALVQRARAAGLPEAWAARSVPLLGGALAAVAAAAVLAGPAAGLLLIGAAALVPRLAGPAFRARRRRQRDEQLPAWLERLASGLRAGLSVDGALAATASTTPAPLGADLAEVRRAVSAGGGLRQALSQWASTPDATPAVALVVSALDLGLHAGGEVARAVDRVAATLRDRVEAQAEVRALATQARASAAVLAVAPLGFTVLLATLEPAVPRLLLTTPMGWACLTGGLGLAAAGAVWMARIVGGPR